MNIHGLKKKLREMRIDLKKSQMELGKEYRNKHKDWNKIDYLESNIRHLEKRMEYKRFLIKKMKSERRKRK